jgi:hypothetical protein
VITMVVDTDALIWHLRGYAIEHLVVEAFLV